MSNALTGDQKFKTFVLILEVESLMLTEPNTLEGEKLDVLVTLIEAYERKHFPPDVPDPVEAIKFEMEQKGKV